MKPKTLPKNIVAIHHPCSSEPLVQIEYDWPRKPEGTSVGCTFTLEPDDAKAIRVILEKYLKRLN